MGKPRATTAEDVARSYHHGIAEIRRCCPGLVHRLDVVCLGRLHAGTFHDLLEPASIFCRFDRPKGCPDEFDAEFFEHVGLCKLHRHVERSLPSKCWENGVRVFLPQDLFDNRSRDGLDIGRICELWVRHDRCRVRVHQDDPVPVFSEHLDGLCAAVVELACLSDDDRAGSDDQDRRDVSSLGHVRPSRHRQTDRTAERHHSDRVRPRGGIARRTP